MDATVAFPLDKKSKDSFDTAQHLINLKNFTQSIHCSYYAVVQMMTYMLAHCRKENNPISYDKQKEKRDLYNSATHEFLLKEICNRLDNPKIKVQFREDFRILKSDRVDADYSERLFTEEEGLDCHDAARRMLSHLKTLS